MKNSITLLTALLISIASFAQQGINYKALIKDDLGNVVSNQTINVQFQIRVGNANGNAVYTETHTETTDANGILVVDIGTGATSDTFNYINWSDYFFWLNVQIDITGGTNYTDISTTRFMAVPFAFHAKSIDSESLNINDLSDGRVFDTSYFIGTGISGIGYRNTVFGHSAMDLGSFSSDNTVVGYSSLYQTSTGNFNTAIGSSSMSDNTTGNYNVALGYNAGINHTTGSGNIFIGKEAGRFNSIPEESNRLYIDNGFSFDPLIYGEFDTRLVRINGTLDVLEGITSVATGNANMIPIAYGTISSTGAILSGTGNFTVNTANAPTFHINVTGSSLSHTNSSASVTPLAGAFRTSSITHSNGALRVYIFNSSGTQVANTFQFVIYKL